MILSRNLTKLLKGIAIILMVAHHSFGFPQWYASGIAYPYLEPYADMIDRSASFAVVPMFVFITGWTYYLHKEKTLAYSLKKITVFLLDFWLVLFAFSALAVYFCGYNLTASGLLMEMFSIESEVMCFSWFVFFYIEMMLFLPFLHKKVENLTFKQTICRIMIFLAVVKLIAFGLELCGLKMSFWYTALNRRFFRYIPIAISGYLCARYNVLDKLYERFVSYCPPKKFLAILACVVLYQIVTSIGAINIGLFLCPIFISLLATFNIDYGHLASRVVMFLGKHSMNIWFLQCIFFSWTTREVFQKYAYWPVNPVLVVVWILALCTCISIPLTKVQEKIDKFISNMYFG